MATFPKKFYESLKDLTINNTYHLSEILGMGGFACVFAAEERARDHLLREVAVKLIDDEGGDPENHDLPNDLNQSTQLNLDPLTHTQTTKVSESIRENKPRKSPKYNPLNELKDATHFNHDHLIRAYAAGSCQLDEIDFLYIVMEKGECSLEHKIQKQCLSPAETITLIRHVATGLAYLHNQGKVHRDIKPANVLWVNSSWKLSDFGLVRSLDAQSYVKTSESYGTYAYMPPEAFNGKISPGWDIWSLGIMTVIALTGKLPYQVEYDNLSITNPLIKQVIEGNLQIPPLPRELDILVRGCLRCDRRQRWTAQQILDYLDSDNPIDPNEVTFEPFGFETINLEVVSSFWKSKEIIAQRQSGKSRQWVQPLLNGVTLEMVEIPEGSFLMGAPEEEEQAENDEYPQHLVTIPRLLMGKHLITQAQWLIVAELPQIYRSLELEPSWFRGDTFPVEQISWYDSIEFCARLSQATGRNYRLPSEAEWEYACRAGTTTPFSCGDTLSTDLANYDGTSTYGLGQPGAYRQTTTPVGSFPPNPFGLYDMHGNLREWCLDNWRENYLKVPRNGDPCLSQRNPPQSSRNWQDCLSKMLEETHDKLLRGGSWDSLAKECRCAYRHWFAPQNRSSSIGFRICCSPIAQSEG
ncbi:MAG: serine/threonine protein kinase [Phormidium sp. GEM2.Bin31]|nr:MAG: serine/threonine protein kinase [Phormidium sp. GEM2.Bin31]